MLTESEKVSEDVQRKRKREAVDTEKVIDIVFNSSLSQIGTFAVIGFYLNYFVLGLILDKVTGDWHCII